MAKRSVFIEQSFYCDIFVTAHPTIRHSLQQTRPVALETCGEVVIASAQAHSVTTGLLTPSAHGPGFNMRHGFRHVRLDQPH